MSKKVKNREFSEAVNAYVIKCNQLKEAGKPIPQIPEYIGKCFMILSEGIAAKPNFSGYTWKEEMIMDGVENCIKAIHNYNIQAATASGKPNAYGYFYQIIIYAFFRRIAKENKQLDIRIKYIEEHGMSHFFNGDAPEHDFIEDLKHRIEYKRKLDSDISVYKKTLKKTQKESKTANLTAFL